MKKATLLLLFAIIFTFIAGSTFSQTVKTEVYTNYTYGIDSTFADPFHPQLFKSESRFAIRDVFFGIDYLITDNFSTNAKIRYNDMTAKVDLYTASINYTNSLSKDLDLNLQFGRTESFWYDYTNSLWGNYAIDNVISDKFGFINRTKTGLVAKLINKNVTGAIEISNDNINNKNKAFNFSAVITPIDNFKIGGFFNDYKISDIVYNVYGGSLFYKFITKNYGDVNLYTEYNSRKNVVDLPLIPIKDEAFTIFGEYFFAESPFSILARFDNYLLYGGTHQQYITGGINYSPNLMYKFGLNWRNFNDLVATKTHNEIVVTAGFNF